MNHRNRYVYNRVGDFPIVHLKKTELKRNLVRSSSVRIAPPNKFNYNRDARAAILRSNSFQLGNGLLSSMSPRVAPVKMRTPESHQIITNHEPIMFNETPHSTNNALEDLEKNCRKRINIEELCMDKSKRICALPGSEPLSETLPPVVDVSSMQSQPYKRAREPISPDKAGTSVTDSPISQQVKRLKIKNNAYLSSLSSSHHELIPKKNFVRPTILRTSQQVEKRPTEEKSMPSPITRFEPAKPSTTPPTAVKKLRLFNVDATQPPPSFRAKFRNFNDDDDDDEFKINFVKPKEKPSNVDDTAIRNIEREKLSRMLHSVGDGLNRTTTEYTSDTIDAPKPGKKVTFSPEVSLKSFGGTATTASLFPLSSSTSTDSVVPKLTFEDKTENKEGEPEKSSEKSTVKETSIAFSITPVPSSVSVTKPAGISFGIGLPSTTSTANVLSPPKPSLPQLDASKSLISFSPAPAQEDDSSAKPVTSDVPVLGGFSFSAPKDGATALSSIQFKSPTTTTVASTTTTESSLPAPTTSAPSFQFGTSSVPTTSAPSFFAPATVATTTTTSSLPPTTFSFGKPTTDLKTATAENASNSSLPATTTTQSTFSFGQPSKPETTQSSGVGFSFGSSTFSAAPTTTAPSSGFSFGNTDKPASTTAAIGGFSFGNSAAKPAAPSTGMFGMPSADSTQTPAATPSLNMFQNAVPSTNATSPPKPGGIFSRLSDKVSDTATASNPSMPTAGSFQFGGLNKNPTPTFGLDANKPASQSEVKPFSFGGDKQPDALPSFGAPLGGTDTSKPQSLSGFSFNAQPKAAENKSTFSFGADKTAEKSTFSFGGSVKTAEVKPTFNFGGSTTTEKQETPGTFSFGGAKPIVENKIDGQAKPSIFGSNTANTPSIFGSASKPEATPTFGAAAQTTTFGQSSFNPSSTTPVFGASSQPNPPAFGAASPPSGGMLFGNSNNPPSFNQSQGFGQANSASTNNNAVFSFNQASKNDLNVQSSQNAPSAGGIFSFGGPTAPTNAQQPSNVFGSGNSGQNVSASFSFKPSTGAVTANNSSSNMFGSTQNNGSAFQFGQNITNASASFTFSPPSASSANSQSSGFNFNVPQTAPVMPTGGAFNFQGAQQVQQQQQPGAMMPGGNQGGMFNIGVGGGQQKRPFRQAARRLK